MKKLIKGLWFNQNKKRKVELMELLIESNKLLNQIRELRIKAIITRDTDKYLIENAKKFYFNKQK